MALNINLPVLLPGQAQLFFFDLALVQDEEPLFYALLNAAEQAQADKKQHSSSKQHYIMTRGIVKILLAHYLQMDAQELILDYQERGKPYLSARPELQFSWSHTEQHLLLGLNLQDAIGVDLENSQRPVHIDALAKRYFHPKEAQRLRELKNEEKKAAFFYLWTMKEAFFKACGTGLSNQMHQLELIDLIEKPRFVIHNSELVDGAVHLQYLSDFSPYSAAVAVLDHSQEIIINMFNTKELL